MNSKTKILDARIQECSQESQVIKPVPEKQYPY